MELPTDASFVSGHSRPYRPIVALGSYYMLREEVNEMLESIDLRTYRRLILIPNDQNCMLVVSMYYRAAPPVDVHGRAFVSRRLCGEFGGS